MLHAQSLRDSYVPTVAMECLVWPPFQVLNFARVPLRHQLVVMNGGTIADSAFLCWYGRGQIRLPYLTQPAANAYITQFGMQPHALRVLFDDDSCSACRARGQEDWLAMSGCTAR